MLGQRAFQCASYWVLKGLANRVSGCCRDFPNGRFVSPKEWLAICQLQGTIERAVLNWEPLRFRPASYPTKGIYDWS